MPKLMKLLGLFLGLIYLSLTPLSAGASDLHSAAKKGDIATITTLLDRGADIEGVMQEFLTTGNDIKFIDEEGNEVVENHIHDIMFENGKIRTIFVYSKPAPTAESEEE